MRSQTSELPGLLGHKALHHNKVTRGGDNKILNIISSISSQVEQFKYLRVLFMSQGRMEQEVNWQICAVSAVLRTPHKSVEVNGELSRKAAPSVYQSIY